MFRLSFRILKCTCSSQLLGIHFPWTCKNKSQAAKDSWIDLMFWIPQFSFSTRCCIVSRRSSFHKTRLMVRAKFNLDKPWAKYISLRLSSEGMDGNINIPGVCRVLSWIGKLVGLWVWFGCVQSCYSSLVRARWIKRIRLMRVLEINVKI